MPIQVTCACGKRFVLGDEFAGKTGKCKACGSDLRIPAAEPAKPKPVPPATRNCTSCQAVLDPEAVICIHCGLDLRTGKQLVCQPRTSEVRSHAAAAEETPSTDPTAEPAPYLDRQTLGVIALTILGLTFGLVVAGIVLSFRVAQQEQAELSREFESFRRYVDFSPELRNEEPFAGPVCITHPSGIRFRSEVSHESFLRKASTLGVCRTTRSRLGRYERMGSGTPTSLEAERITVDVCLIDLKNPQRRRVVTAISEPPDQIRSDSEHNTWGEYTIDGKKLSQAGIHRPGGLVEEVLKLAVRD